jgi:hypothetical protein
MTLKKEKAKEYNLLIRDNKLDQVPLGLDVCHTRNTEGRVTVKLGDLYGNVFIFKDKKGDEE